MFSSQIIIDILVALGAVIAGLVAGIFVFGRAKQRSMASYEEEAAEYIHQSEEEEKKIHKDIQVQVEELKNNYIENEERRKDQLQRIEQLLTSKQEQLDKKQEKIQLLEKTIAEKEEEIGAMKQKNNTHQEEILNTLCRNVGWNQSQAKEHILAQYSQDLEIMREERLHLYESYLEEEKVRIAKKHGNGGNTTL